VKRAELRMKNVVRYALCAMRITASLVLCGFLCVSAYAEEAAVPKRKTHVALRPSETFGHKGSGAGEFLHPHDVAIDPSGNILVADTGNHRIVKLNAKGAYLTEVGGFGWDDRQFNEPSGISTGTGLEIYVSDRENQRIALYSQHLKLISIVGGRDVGGALAMGKVGGVATTREGEIYVTDQDLDQVIQVSTFSRTDRSFGGYGYGSGELRAPSAVDVDTEGRVYVCDTENDRVAVFDRFGNYERELGAEVLTRPEGVVAGPSGVLFVSDTGSHRVLAFDVEKDEVVGRMGGPKRGIEPGQFDTPRGLAFDLRSNALLVVDSGNHRLQKFKTLILKK
jgi:DNA-binding beta-propeller fold protein YncE